MAGSFELSTPLPGVRFGGRISLVGATADAAHFIKTAEADPDALPRAFAATSGLLLIQGMDRIADDPGLLLCLSRVFGPEVEDYRENLTPLNMVHETVPEIFIVSNTPPVGRQPPRRPDPPLTPDGKLPVQFPHRRSWHTDQSYRRPPPDLSLFLAVLPVPKDQGRTLFADGTAAYDALSPEMKARIEGLDGIHVQNTARRNYDAVLAGETPKDLKPHQRPQRQPLVRVHPVTGLKALYMCELGQMDWLDGPIAGMQPGPHGDGRALLFELMTHMTQPRFVYVHEWTKGDLIIWDNRCLVHAATWFDVTRHPRVMWRTTVSGNPGAAYSGAAKSWIKESTL